MARRTIWRKNLILAIRGLAGCVLVVALLLSSGCDKSSSGSSGGSSGSSSPGGSSGSGIVAFSDGSGDDGTGFPGSPGGADPTLMPEPGTLALLGMSIVAVVAVSRRRRT